MEEVRSNFRASLIGVGKYLMVPDMPAMIADVKALYNVLTDTHICGFPTQNVQALTGKAATCDNIRAHLEYLIQTCTPSSTAFCYFASHGIQNSQGDTYLCPYETDPEDLEHTALSGAEFARLLSRIPARRLIVLLDACHASGVAMSRAVGADPIWHGGLPENYLETLDRGSGMVIISSSRADQLSWDRKDHSHGVFTWYLLEGLKGAAAAPSDQYIYLFQLFDYIQQKVRAEVYNAYGTTQEPIMYAKEIDGNFPLALCSQEHKHLNDLREQIIRNPLQGAKALSDYLAAYPQWQEQKGAVDLRRTNLQKIEQETRLFGPDQSMEHTRNRIVYHLLDIIQEISNMEQH